MSTPSSEVCALLRETTVGELIEFAIQQEKATLLEAPAALFRKQGETWVLRLAGKTVYVKHRLGLEYISYLLANPGKTISMVRLYFAVAKDHGASDGAQYWVGPDDESISWQGPSSGSSELLADGLALSQCEERLRQVEQEIALAEERGDNALALSLREERGQLVAYLRSCTGHQGRLRRMADAGEKIRKSVSNAIARAVAAIYQAHEPLGRHLRNSIRTGYNTMYDPETPPDWAL